LSLLYFAGKNLGSFGFSLNIGYHLFRPRSGYFGTLTRSIGYTQSGFFIPIIVTNVLFAPRTSMEMSHCFILG
jgi:hypothetical protein